MRMVLVWIHSFSFASIPTVSPESVSVISFTPSKEQSWSQGLTHVQSREGVLFNKNMPKYEYRSLTLEGYASKEP